MVVAPCPAVGLRISVVRRMRSVAATLPASNRGRQRAMHRAVRGAVAGRRSGVGPSCAVEVGRGGGRRTRSPRLPGVLAAPTREWPAGPDGRDEGEREERSEHRAGIVHGPLEAVCPAEGGGVHRVGEERVPGRPAESPRRPCSGPQEPDLPDRGGEADPGREDGRRGVAAERYGAAAAWVISERTPSELREAAQPVGDALDQPERGGRGAEHDVRNDGSSAVGTSCPRSERKLARPIPRTPGVSQVGRRCIARAYR